MSDIQRHAKNLTKLLLMAILGIAVIGVVVVAVTWPMVIWYQFDQPLYLAVTITLVWIAAIL